MSKLTFLITLLSVAAAILVNAPDSDEDLGPEDPLVWADVQRHFERADRRSVVVPDLPGNALPSITDGDMPDGPLTLQSTPRAQLMTPITTKDKEEGRPTSRVTEVPREDLPIPVERPSSRRRLSPRHVSRIRTMGG